MPQNHKNRTIYILASGFLFVLLSMLLLLFAALREVESSIDHIDTNILQQTEKSALVTDMVNLARDRVLYLMKMLVTKDSFQRDELMLAFNRNGSAFIRDRRKLLSMPLSSQELALLEQQQLTASRVAPLLQQVVDLAFTEGKDDEARELLEKTIPMQDGLFDIMSRLLAYQQKITDDNIDQDVVRYKHNLFLIAVLASFVFLSCLVIIYVVIRRITHDSHELLQQKERAQVTLHSIGDGVITVDKHGRVENINREAEILTGYDLLEIRGREVAYCCRIFEESIPSKFLDPVAEVIQQKKTISSQNAPCLLRKDGTDLAIDYTASPIFDPNGEIDGVVLVFKNDSETRALHYELSHQAAHDFLTGLYNRRQFEKLVADMIEKTQGSSDVHSMCYVDLDQFKVVNDTCGHEAGDELLKQMTHLLRDNLRDSDCLARLGGDEFGIVLKNCPVTVATNLMEDIRSKVEKFRFSWEGKTFSVTISAGIVPLTRNVSTLYELLSSADSACYIAKDGGRNRVYVCEDDDVRLNIHQNEMNWVHKINEALENDRFVLFSQRIESIRGDDSHHMCEVLVRMLDDNDELIRPMAFIPSAERYNLMAAIDRWVIHHAFRCMADRGPDYDMPRVVSINLSGQSLGEAGLLEFISTQLEQNGIDPAQVCFEITETAAITNIAEAQYLMNHLKKKGCLFSLDDFGSGLSSFEYLKNLPVDYLKIDGAFVRNILYDDIDQAMVRAINDLGHVMGKKTIAEFVENREICQLLKKMGVDYVQGLGIDEPHPLLEQATLYTYADPALAGATKRS